MKKLLVRIALALLILLVLAVVAVGLFLDAGVKRGIETVGPMLTKVSIKLDSVNLHVLSGSGTIKGLLVGNPEGYKTPTAIQVGTASLALSPGSVLSDKVVIKSINVQAPEITYETNLKESNLSKILDNLQEATGGGTTEAQPKGEAKKPAEPKEAKAGKKLQVDDFLISGAKLHISLTVLGGKSATVPLKDIHLTGLGQGPDGITAGEVIKKALQAIQQQAAEAAGSLAADIGKGAADLTKGAAKGVGDAAGSVTKSIGDLFKKKPDTNGPAAK
jgi:uncharacterized protein involved in outer membrane biogenesis